MPRNTDKNVPKNPALFSQKVKKEVGQKDKKSLGNKCSTLANITEKTVAPFPSQPENAEWKD